MLKRGGRNFLKNVKNFYYICVLDALVVAVDADDRQVDRREREPAGTERDQEQDDVVAPAHLDDRREEVAEEAQTASGDVTTDDVVFARLLDQSATRQRHRRSLGIAEIRRRTALRALHTRSALVARSRLKSSGQNCFHGLIVYSASVAVLAPPPPHPKKSERDVLCCTLPSCLGVDYDDDAVPRTQLNRVVFSLLLYTSIADKKCHPPVYYAH